MERRFLIILGLIIVIMIGGVIFVMNGKQDDSGDSVADPLAIMEDDHIYGNKDAKVKIIEYSDYQCPSCSIMYPLMKQMEMEFSKDVLFVYRNLPISSIHLNTMAAHRAAEAANLQGKYFEMSDLLYTSQAQWENASNPKGIFESYAQEISLDVEKFKQDADGQQVFDRISRDLKTSDQLNIKGTPTFIINGLQIGLPQSVEDFRETIQNAIDAANQT